MCYLSPFVAGVGEKNKGILQSIRLYGDEKSYIYLADPSIRLSYHNIDLNCNFWARKSSLKSFPCLWQIVELKGKDDTVSTFDLRDPEAVLSQYPEPKNDSNMTRTALISTSLVVVGNWPHLETNILIVAWLHFLHLHCLLKRSLFAHVLTKEQKQMR